jgi:hypothetical protein
MTLSYAVSTQWKTVARRNVSLPPHMIQRKSNDLSPRKNKKFDDCKTCRFHEVCGPTARSRRLAERCVRAALVSPRRKRGHPLIWRKFPHFDKRGSLNGSMQRLITPPLLSGQHSLQTRCVPDGRSVRCASKRPKSEILNEISFSGGLKP